MDRELARARICHYCLRLSADINSLRAERVGLPIGLQIVGPPYGEAELLQVAAWCEAALNCALKSPIDPRRAGQDTEARS
jgi:hypothetical protein